jgi:Fe-S-cluster containining protein
MAKTYDCAKCPGYCCSYPTIPLTKPDLHRLARHFGLGFREAKAKYTVARDDDPYTMRRKADKHFGRVCQFFDTEKRRCGIYQARPSTCRSYPERGSCGYYDFLKSERWLQDDPEFIVAIDGR